MAWSDKINPVITAVVLSYAAISCSETSVDPPPTQDTGDGVDLTLDLAKEPDTSGDPDLANDSDRIDDPAQEPDLPAETGNEPDVAAEPDADATPDADPADGMDAADTTDADTMDAVDIVDEEVSAPGSQLTWAMAAASTSLEIIFDTDIDDTTVTPGDFAVFETASPANTLSVSAATVSVQRQPSRRSPKPLERSTRWR